MFYHILIFTYIYSYTMHMPKTSQALYSLLELKHPRCVCIIKVWYKEVKTQLVYYLLTVLLTTLLTYNKLVVF